jgi:hypothetical protein
MNMLFFWFVPAVGALALFGFLAVASWSEERRKERESFYRSEVLKKLVDNPGSDTKPVFDMIREEENNRLRRRREGLMLGGFITTAVGIGVMFFLDRITGEEAIWTVGIIPLLIGVILACFGLFVAQKPKPPQAS